MKINRYELPVSKDMNVEEDNYYLIKATEIKMKPPWIRWWCIHKFTGGVRMVYDEKGNKRHAYICMKCGQRNYID